MVELLYGSVELRTALINAELKPFFLALSLYCGKNQQSPYCNDSKWGWLYIFCGIWITLTGSFKLYGNLLNLKKLISFTGSLILCFVSLNSWSVCEVWTMTGNVLVYKYKPIKTTINTASLTLVPVWSIRCFTLQLSWIHQNRNFSGQYLFNQCSSYIHLLLWQQQSCVCVKVYDFSPHIYLNLWLFTLTYKHTVDLKRVCVSQMWSPSEPLRCL